MKKIILLFSLSLLFTLIFTAPAFSATYNKIDRVLKVPKNSYTTESNAPRLIICDSFDHTENLVFELILNNAEWTYNESGTITQGVTFKKDSKKKLVIYVDIDKSDVKYVDLPIPLYVKFTNAGNVTVTLNSNSTTVSGGTYTFAECNDGTITVGSEKIVKVNQSGTLSKFWVNDESSRAFTSGSTITLTLSDGFVFANTPEILGSFKFKDAVSFSVDSSNPSKGYIKITQNTPEGSGRIYLSNIQISRADTKNYNEAEITAQYKNEKRSVSVAKYDAKAANSIIKEVTEESTEETTEKKPENPTSKLPNPVLESNIPENLAIFTVDNSTYYLNGEELNLEAPAYIDENNRLMLPLKAVAKILGLSDSQILWDSASKSVTLKNNTSTAVVYIGEKTIILNDSPIPTDSCAVINNSRVFLPVKSILTVFGLSDDNITWEANNKKIVISF